MLRRLQWRVAVGWLLLRRAGPKAAFHAALMRAPLIERAVKALVLKDVGAVAVEKQVARIDREALEKFKVSFVIPNNNGLAVGLESLIASIRRQTHRNIEIISVDSGSTDRSVEIMRELGVAVYEIAPETFSHSYSRNLGASKATGDFLVFTVSDAEFRDPDWVRSNLALLVAYGAASVTTPQGYTSKASLYARLLAGFLHGRFPRGSGITITNPRPWLMRFIPGAVAGKVFGVDDTNHMVRADVFRSLRFERNTVEDMDFGRRLFSAGHRFILSNLSSIVHFHDFGDRYKYFCRVYCDVKVIRQLVNTVPPFYYAYDSLLTVTPMFGISFVRLLESHFEASGEEYITSRRLGELASVVFEERTYRHDLDWSLREDVENFVARELRLEPGAWTVAVTEVERFLLVYRYRIAWGAVLHGLRRAKQYMLAREDAIEIALCAMIQVLASCLAELNAEDSADPRLARLAALKWK